MNILFNVSSEYTTCVLQGSSPDAENGLDSCCCYNSLTLNYASLFCNNVGTIQNTQFYFPMDESINNLTNINPVFSTTNLLLIQNISISCNDALFFTSVQDSIYLNIFNVDSNCLLFNSAENVTNINISKVIMQYNFEADIEYQEYFFIYVTQAQDNEGIIISNFTISNSISNNYCILNIQDLNSLLYIENINFSNNLLPSYYLPCDPISVTIYGNLGCSIQCTPVQCGYRYSVLQYTTV